VKSTIDAIGEGVSIGVAAMCAAFIVGAFLSFVFEPPRDDLAAKQELKGLADPMTYRNIVQQILDGR
jgi:hypothetical protein